MMATTTVKQTWHERGHGNGYHGDCNGDNQGNIWQNAKIIFCWSSERKSEWWLQELRDWRQSGIPKLREIIDIWADIATSAVLYDSCPDSDGESECILNCNGDSCAQENNTRLWIWEQVDSQKYNVHHFLFVFIWRCDRLFVVKFHTVHITIAVAVIFAILWLLP